MKKSSGKPLRVRGFVLPDKKRVPGVKGKVRKPNKKNSKKWILAIFLLLILAVSIFIISIPRGRDKGIDPLMRQDGIPGAKEKAIISPANIKRRSNKPMALKKDPPLSKIRIAIPAEKKENDFGTTLHLDPPPERD